jgi:hypothetical protein
MSHFTRPRQVLFRLLLLILAFSSQIICAKPINAQRTQESISQASARNLARWNMGATLILVKDEQFQRISVPELGDFEESIFLSSNAGLSYKIPHGSHNYIIDLGKTAQLTRFSLNNKSARGSFELFTATSLDQLDRPVWHDLQTPTAIIPGVLPAITLPEIEARYLLIRFEIETTGKIGHFNLFGN